MNIFPVACHTDNVGPGSTFVAIKGQKQDGVLYIVSALNRGATSIIVQKDSVLSSDIIKKIQDFGAQLEFVDNCRKELAYLSAKKNGYPAKKLKIIGVTGTKGKTSTVFMLEHILKTAGYKTALLSTIYNKIGDTVFSASLTTAQPDYLHDFFSRCIDFEVEYVVMEVAAQALSLHRVDGIEFDGALFTNFDQEHAEFYKNLDDYFSAKSLLFHKLKPGAPVLINIDDKYGKKILNLYKDFLSFGFSDSDFSVKQIEEVEYLACNIIINKDRLFNVCCPSLFGRFNIYNIIGALSLAYELGVSIDICIKAAKSFSSIPGRLEKYNLPNGSICFIDNAHNPSSFKAVLSSLRIMTNDLIVVFGAGGERDKIKRPEMGKIAAEYADHVFLTSDNPRSEKAFNIIEQIYFGIDKKDHEKVTCELDRKVAIEKAYKISKNGTIIALLGKGPDEYELIGDQKIPFSEKEILKSL